ncbi:MAG: hypothetical protein MUC94_05615, partial [bacterium]|nr:hypothetical protein [bacterium]
MKFQHVVKFIAIAVVLLALSVPVKAQYTANNLFTFLQETYNRHDTKLNDFLIVELNQFVQTFADSGHAVDASYLLAKVWDEKGKRHEALAAAYKT